MDYEIKTAKQEFEPFEVVLKVNDLEDLKALLMLANMEGEEITKADSNLSIGGYGLITESALPTDLWEDLVAKCFYYGVI